MFRLPRSRHPAAPAAGDRGASGVRRAGRVRRAAVGAALVPAVALTVAACAGGPIAQSTPVSNGSSFVAGSYSTTVYSVGSRPVVPDVTGITLTGEKLALSGYRGAVVVMNFWGSWCEPCREEAPALAKLATQLRAGVRFLGVDIRDSPASAEAFLRTFRITYPSLNDPGDEVALAFTGTVPPVGIPTTLVLDRSGRIAARVVGGVSYAGLKALITQISAEPR